MLDSNSPPLLLACRLRTSSQSSGESREPSLCFMILWTFAHTGHHVPLEILYGTASQVCPSLHTHSSFALQPGQMVDRQSPPRVFASFLNFSICIALCIGFL